MGSSDGPAEQSLLALVSSTRELSVSPLLCRQALFLFCLSSIRIHASVTLQDNNSKEKKRERDDGELNDPLVLSPFLFFFWRGGKEGSATANCGGGRRRTKGLLRGSRAATASARVAPLPDTLEEPSRGCSQHSKMNSDGLKDLLHDQSSHSSFFLSFEQKTNQTKKRTKAPRMKDLDSSLSLIFFFVLSFAFSLS